MWHAPCSHRTTDRHGAAPPAATRRAPPQQIVACLDRSGPTGRHAMLYAAVVFGHLLGEETPGTSLEQINAELNA